VFVALGIQHAMHMGHIVICGLSGVGIVQMLLTVHALACSHWIQRISSPALCVTRLTVSLSEAAEKIMKCLHASNHKHLFSTANRVVALIFVNVCLRTVVIFSKVQEYWN
jgi:hypothetical protein